MTSLDLKGSTVFTGSVTEAYQNSISGPSADRSTKTISNIVRCVGYLVQLVHVRGAFKPDPENVWETVKVHRLLLILH